jgi:hypothetical protein
MKLPVSLERPVKTQAFALKPEAAKTAISMLLTFKVL